VDVVSLDARWSYLGLADRLKVSVSTYNCKGVASCSIDLDPSGASWSVS
jgi:hypothetical protein